MRSLLQNRKIRRKCYRAFFLLAGLALFALGFVGYSYAKERASLPSQAVSKFLSWEKYWYGEFFGEDCYNKLIGKEVRIAIRQKEASEIAHVMHCDDKYGQIAEQKTFDVYIANTNVLFHGVWLGDKPVAEISMGSSSPGCNVEDLEPRVTNLLKDSRTAFLDVVLPNVEAFRLPPLAENLKEQIVLEAVHRSMLSFINSEKITRNGRLLLARFNNTDPFLLVYYEGNDKVYLLDFPPDDILRKKNSCVPVFSADPYLGEVSDVVKERVMSHLLNKIKANSIELQLQVKAREAK